MLHFEIACILFSWDSFKPYWNSLTSVFHPNLCILVTIICFEIRASTGGNILQEDGKLQWLIYLCHRSERHKYLAMATWTYILKYQETNWHDGTLFPGIMLNSVSVHINRASNVTNRVFTDIIVRWLLQSGNQNTPLFLIKCNTLQLYVFY